MAGPVGRGEVTVGKRFLRRVEFRVRERPKPVPAQVELRLGDGHRSGTGQRGERADHDQLCTHEIPRFRLMRG